MPFLLMMIQKESFAQISNFILHQMAFLKKALHTYSIHGNAVSYIDKITEESIPTLPIGTCVFSEIATPMPLKLKIKELPNEKKPDSHTLQFEQISEVAQ